MIVRVPSDFDDDRYQMAIQPDNIWAYIGNFRKYIDMSTFRRKKSVILDHAVGFVQVREFIPDPTRPDPWHVTHTRPVPVPLYPYVVLAATSIPVLYSCTSTARHSVCLLAQCSALQLYRSYQIRSHTNYV